MAAAGYLGRMALTVTRQGPSVAALATAWALALASDVGWSVGLYNYDGEMGDTPPPSIWAITCAEAVVATALVTVAWVACRLWRPATQSFWLLLFGCFAAKGFLVGGLEVVSVLIYGPAPFTLAGCYRGAALSVVTALVSGIVVALVFRAIDARRFMQRAEDHFG